MQVVKTDAVEIAYDTLGRADDPPLLLIAGLGMPLLAWPDDLCRQLVERGLYVLRFDNRGSGRSTYTDRAPARDTLSDMARDAVAVLEALGLESAHLAGASMGGAIAQTLAIEQPERARSLTSIMSSTGDRTVGRPAPAALSALAGLRGLTGTALVDQAVVVARALAARAFPPDETDVRLRVAGVLSRGYDSAGVARQLLAAVTAPDRTQALRSLRVPALIVHGADDPLVDVSGGRACAAAIPDAALLIVEDMGHELPARVWPTLVDRIVELVVDAERSRT